jgi:hypothetical protein
MNTNQDAQLWVRLAIITVSVALVVIAALVAHRVPKHNPMAACESLGFTGYESVPEPLGDGSGRYYYKITCIDEPWNRDEPAVVDWQDYFGHSKYMEPKGCNERGECYSLSMEPQP